MANNRKIPLYTDEQILETVKTVNYNTEGYGIGGEDDTIANIVTQGIYNVGATAINENPALLNQYHSLPNLDGHNGGHTSTKPLQSIFILQVALDSIDPQSIYAKYEQLMPTADASHRSYPGYYLPNGGDFIFPTHALREFMEAYICNNPKRFLFLSSDQLTRISKNYSDSNYCISILGFTEKKDQLFILYENIINRKLSCPVSKEPTNMVGETSRLFSSKPNSEPVAPIANSKPDHECGGCKLS